MSPLVLSILPSHCPSIGVVRLVKRPEPDAGASHLLVANPAAGTFVTTVFRHAAPLDRRGRTKRPGGSSVGCAAAVSPACQTPWRPERRPLRSIRRGPASGPTRTHSWGGRNTHAEPLVRRAAPVLGERAGDRPGGVALPKGNLRAGGRSRRPTRGASHRPVGGKRTPRSRPPSAAPT